MSGAAPQPAEGGADDGDEIDDEELEALLNALQGSLDTLEVCGWQVAIAKCIVVVVNLDVIYSFRFAKARHSYINSNNCVNSQNIVIRIKCR